MVRGALASYQSHHWVLMRFSKSKTCLCVFACLWGWDDRELATGKTKRVLVRVCISVCYVCPLVCLYLSKAGTELAIGGTRGVRVCQEFSARGWTWDHGAMVASLLSRLPYLAIYPKQHHALWNNYPKLCQRQWWSEKHRKIKAFLCTCVAYLISASLRFILARASCSFRSWTVSSCVLSCSISPLASSLCPSFVFWLLWYCKKKEFRRKKHKKENWLVLLLNFKNKQNKHETLHHSLLLIINHFLFLYLFFVS